MHRFDQIWRANGIEHRSTKPNHPWTNGQVERMNRTPFTTTRMTSSRPHLSNFVTSYNFARRLKTLNGLTRYETICKAWTDEPHRFIIDPIHQMPGLNT